MTTKFVISDDKEWEFSEWRKEHNKVCHESAGAIGGKFSFIFTQTGLGCITIAKCMCGEELDLTHSENW